MGTWCLPIRSQTFLPGEKPIFVHVDAVTATTIFRLPPQYGDCLEPDGSLILKLGMYLYGLPQAGSQPVLCLPLGSVPPHALHCHT